MGTKKLNVPDFEIKEDVNDYLSNKVNLSVYEQLTEHFLWKDLFDPLDFFNQLYQLHALILANKNRPLDLINHIKELRLEPKELFYLLYRIDYILDLPDMREGSLVVFQDLLRKELDILKYEVFNVFESDPLREKYNFNHHLVAAEKLPSYTERLEYFLTVKNTYLKEKDFYDDIFPEMSYGDLCDLEIQKYKELISVERDGSASKGNQDLSGFDFSKRTPHSDSQLERVYNLLVREKILSGEKSDFTAMFSVGRWVKGPMQWLLIAPNSKRGNQEALCTFLELMFGGLPNDVKRSARSLFIDIKGEFLSTGYKLSARVIKDYKTESQLKDILDSPDQT